MKPSEKLIACGIDIESISRVQRLLEEGIFPRYLFEDTEWETIRKDCHLASRYFTAKEALFKALGIGWALSMANWADAVITNDGSNIEVAFKGGMNEIFRREGFQRVTILEWEAGENVITGAILEGADVEAPVSEMGLVDLKEFKKLTVLPIQTWLSEGVLLDKKDWCHERVTEHLAGHAAAAESIKNLMKRMTSAEYAETPEIKISSGSNGKPELSNVDELNLTSVPAFSIAHNRKFAVGLAASYPSP